MKNGFLGLDLLFILAGSMQVCEELFSVICSLMGRQVEK